MMAISRYIRTWYSKINEDPGFTRRPRLHTETLASHGDPGFTWCAYVELAEQVKVDTAKN